MRDAVVSRPALTFMPTRCAVLLRGLGVWLGSAAAFSGCSQAQKPGVMIELRVEQEEFRPEVVIFDWISLGQPVLVQGQLTGIFKPEDPSFVASLFIETNGPLVEARLIAVRGYQAGLIVSGSQGVVQRSLESVQSLNILLGAPLPDDNNNGIPDLVDRCTSAEIGPRCLEPTDAGISANPDAGSGIVTPDASQEPEVDGSI